jgi:hypothetical protein
MKRIVTIAIAALLIPAITNGKDTLKQPSNNTIQVLKISGQDQRAIIKTADGKMKIIKPGDVIDKQESVASRQESAGSGKSAVGKSQTVELKVIEIAEGRVVLEEKKGDAIEKIIIRLVDGKQKVERMKKTSDSTPLLYAPQSMQTSTGNGHPAAKSKAK